MKNVKKNKTKNQMNELVILKSNELLQIRGGELPTQGDPTQRDIDFD